MTGLVLCTGQVAQAQSAAEKAAADTLFGEGKKLITAGDTAAACAKFEASLEKVAQLGTQLALASCYEKLDRTASAWAMFRGAASAAAKAHDPQRQHFAEQHAAALEAQLSRLVIKVEPGYRIDGLEVKRDGVELSPAELGTPVPVDPGEHAVEASAPGWMPWSTKVVVAPRAGVVEVIVPALGKGPVRVDDAKAEAGKTAALQPTTADDPRQARRRLAYIVGGSGVAVIGASLIFGAVASSRWSDSKAHCHNGLCDQTGFDLAGSAQSMGNLSTGTFLVGTAAVAAGVILYLTAPPHTEAAPPIDPSALRVVPAVGPAQVGLTLQGGF